MNILIVDDQASMRSLVSAVVQKAGHQVYEASNGDDAVALCQEKPVDMVLLDVEMAGLNGFETARSIREQSEEWFPIVFLSARTEKEFFVEGINSGGDFYLHKPLVPEVLDSTVQAMSRIVAAQDELFRARLAMEKLAHKDALTGLVNRRGFDHALELALKQSIHDKQPVGLILLDVDHFKDFNDHYGHQAGDECLKQVASAIQGALCRERDIAARYGGEEFVVILPNTDAAGAHLVGERIRAAIEALAIPHAHSSVAGVVTASGGVAISQRKATADSLVAEADDQLYRAKAAGRNRVVG